MPIITIKFGSYDFTDTIEEWDVNQNLIIDSASIPKRPGQIFQGGKIGVREYSLKGSLQSETREGLRTLRNALNSGILNKTANLYLFDDRFVECRVVDYSYGYIQGAALYVLNFDLVFQSSLPYEQSNTLQSTTVVTTTSGNTDFTITNNGNYETFAKITVTAPGGSSIANNLSVNNQTRNETFSYLGTVTAGNDFIVNGLVVPFVITNNGTDAISQFSGQFIKLDPGNNSFRAITEVGASVKVEHRDAYV